MPIPIFIKIEDKIFEAELNDGKVAQAVAGKLPLTIRMSRWGDEYYGDCGVRESETEDAREIMAVGELAYWPPGGALCIFFGPTPASTDEKPRAASAVVPIGKVLRDAENMGQFGGSIQATFSKT